MRTPTQLILHSRYNIFCNKLFTALLIATLMFLYVNLPILASTADLVIHAQSDFSCASISEIPLAECEALIALADANPDSQLGTSWFRNNEPCGWSHITCLDNHVIELNLSDSQLVALPAEIGAFSSLSKLLLINNQLTTLPAEVGSLSNLTVLNLYRNQLTDLPVEIGDLSSLTALSVPSNQLTTLPTEIGNLSSLLQLWLQDNQLTSIPTEMGNLSSLTTLSLSNNQLTSLPMEISKLYPIASVSVENNPLVAQPVKIDTQIQGRTGASGHIEVDTPGPYHPYYEAGDSIQLTAIPDAGSQFTSWSASSNLDTQAMQPTIMITVTQSDDLYTAYFDSPFDCSAVSEIPQTECQALIAFHIANFSSPLQGSNGSVIGWVENNSPCSWVGIECEDGHVSKLRLSRSRITTVPMEIGNFPLLKVLNLSGNQLVSLPPEIGNLSSLTGLYVGINQLTSLPAEIGNLSLLAELYLYNNQLMNLPAEIGNLSSLDQVDLRENQLTSLPAEIGNLSTLSQLQLNDNQLTNLPAEIGNLSLLTELSVRNNQLTSLPAEIGNLSALSKLYLDENQLTSLPAEIGTLSVLSYLHLDDNQLASLPAEIGNLSALKWLELNNNQLTSLPSEIGNLSSLTWVKLNDNQLTSLPQEIKYLDSLYDFEVENNPIASPTKVILQTNGSGTVERNVPGPFYTVGTPLQITAVPTTSWQFVRWEGPQDLGSDATQPTITISAMEKIHWRNYENTYTAYFRPDLDCANVSEIPEGECEALIEIFNTNPSKFIESKWLTTESPCSWGRVTCSGGRVIELDLYSMYMKRLPKEIKSFALLESLQLNGNPNIKFPAEIGTLSSLTDLDLSNNLLTSVPPEIWNLSSLTILDLGYNKLTALPNEIENLTALTQLDLSRNQLTELPSELWEQKNLTSLSLTGNLLISLPSEIDKLTALRSLSLYDNQLTTLPSEIGNLHTLTSLSVGNNNFTTVPAELRSLTNLRSLNLSDNQLSNIPLDIIDNLSSLNQLYTGGNPLTTRIIGIYTSSQGDGIICRSKRGPFYSEGVSVQLTAVPRPGAQFTRWSSTEDLGVQETQPTIQVTAEKRVTYTAIFSSPAKPEPIQHDGAATVLYMPILPNDSSPCGSTQTLSMQVAAAQTSADQDDARPFISFETSVFLPVVTQ